MSESDSSVPRRRGGTQSGDPLTAWLSPLRSAWMLGLSALILLAMSVGTILSLRDVSVKYPAYRTFSPIGISSSQTVAEMVRRLQEGREAQPLPPEQVAKVTWFLKQCGTTILRGERAKVTDLPPAAEDLVVLELGCDPQSATRWYRLPAGVLEVGEDGPAYYPEFGKWYIQYRESTAPYRTSRALGPLRSIRVNYTGLPGGLRLWVEQPGGVVISWEEGTPQWRLSWPALVTLLAVVMPGLGIALVGLGAWRNGSASRGGAVAVTLWATALMGVWVWVAATVQPIEAFVDVLRYARQGATRLPWVSWYVVTAWGFATAYWLHLGAVKRQEQVAGGTKAT